MLLTGRKLERAPKRAYPGEQDDIVDTDCTMQLTAYPENQLLAVEKRGDFCLFSRMLWLVVEQQLVSFLRTRTGVVFFQKKRLLQIIYLQLFQNQAAGFIDLAVVTSLLSTNVCEVLFPSFLCGLTRGRWTTSMYVAGAGFPVYPGLLSCTKG